jgi:hypothetical protein
MPGLVRHGVGQRIKSHRKVGHRHRDAAGGGPVDWGARNAARVPRITNPPNPAPILCTRNTFTARLRACGLLESCKSGPMSPAVSVNLVASAPVMSIHVKRPSCKPIRR